jgi:hypothetical protein
MRHCQKQENSSKVTVMDSYCGVSAIDSWCVRDLACFSTPWFSSEQNQLARAKVSLQL